MNHIHAMLAGDGDDPLDIEIGADRPLPFADAVGLIGLETMHREAVFLRVDGDGAEAELRRGAHDADGDFRAIGDEEFFGFGGRGDARWTCGWTHTAGRVVKERAPHCQRDARKKRIQPRATRPRTLAGFPRGWIDAAPSGGHSARLLRPFTAVHQRKNDLGGEDSVLERTEKFP